MNANAVVRNSYFTVPLVILMTMLISFRSEAQTQRVTPRIPPKTNSGASEKKKSVQTPGKQIPQKLTFKEVNPEFSKLKDKVVEVKPGLQMRVGDYVKGSSFKTIPKFQRFLTKDFERRYLKATPDYREEVEAKGDRLIVRRTLKLKTDNPCAIPDGSSDDVSICFRKTTATSPKASQKLTQELDSIRQKLRSGKKAPGRFKNSMEKKVLQRLDEIVEMDDEALIEFLLNSADEEKSIVHESEVPFVAEAELLPTALDSAASAGDVPGQQSASVNNTRLEFDRVQESTMDFIDGTTWTKGIEDSYEVTFAGSTWFTDRYYARFSYEVSIGVGLRFPVQVDARSTISHVRDMNGEVSYPATSLCSGVTRQSAAIHCASRADLVFKGTGVDGDAAFYQSAGMPADLMFDAKEFVFVVTANATLYASIPGPNFSESFGKKVDFSRDFATPIGNNAKATLAEVTLRGKNVGLALQAGALGVSGWAALNPGIRVIASEGKITLPVTPFEQTATLQGNTDVPLSRHSWSAPVVVSRRFGNNSTAPWGAVVNAPQYQTEITVTPTLGVEIGVEVVYWSWDTVFGPYDIDALAVSLGDFVFSHHPGTVQEYRQFISGCEPGDPQCVTSYREELPPSNMVAAVAAHQIVSSQRGDEGAVITVYEGNWGSWSPMDKCRRGTYARTFALRLEDRRGSGDDTALNGIALWCTDPNGQNGNLVVSHPGHWGDWKPYAGECAIQGDFIRKAQLKYEEAMGDGDDTAANGFQVKCSDSIAHQTIQGEWGTWQPMRECPAHQVVCGIQTRVESKRGGGDDTALNGVKLQCCNYDPN
ncbi:MAG: hypothetical protein JXX14_21690 [Deltaproteobacteria bacterium]|nr:hypothetical protein [Deltaproteobacteria bacterium]